MCEYGRKSKVIGEKILISKRGKLKLRLRGGKNVISLKPGCKKSPILPGLVKPIIQRIAVSSDISNLKTHLLLSIKY
jgi:hypothetical protein